MSKISNNHVHGSGIPKRRPDRKRRALRKASYFFVFLAVVFFVLSLLFVMTALLMSGTIEAKNQRLILAGGSCAMALVSLLFFFVSLWIRRIYSNRKSHSRLSVSNSGSAMLLTLVLVGTAAGLLMQVQTLASIRLRAADSSLSMTRLKIAAGDTAHKLLQVLADDEDLLADHLGEKWSQPIDIEYPDGVKVHGWIIDAQQYFDINNLTATRPANSSERSAGILRDIMRDCVLENYSQRLDALRDWIDSDGEGEYENPHYGRLEQPYSTPGSFLQNSAELDWVAEWNADDYWRINAEGRPALAELTTIIPVKRNDPIRVNINTAPAELLRDMLGSGSSQIVELLVSLRKDAPLRSLALLESALGKQALESLLPYLDVKSSYFDIVVDAESSGRGATLRALAHRSSDGTVSVLRWSI